MTSDETLESWLTKEIQDAENIYQMYRSYRQHENTDGMVALERLKVLNEVRDKITQLWG